MNSWQHRLVAERNQLHSRVGKLRDFITSTSYLSVAPAHRVLLEKQHKIMTQYLDVLNQRIAIEATGIRQ